MNDLPKVSFFVNCKVRYGILAWESSNAFEPLTMPHKRLPGLSPILATIQFNEISYRVTIIFRQ